ncbi:MAG: hypothetical protein SGJ20_04660 [Planctomycetota bacterium]|nr:hypothetical protein [Planctomycetota bacterium]
MMQFDIGSVGSTVLQELLGYLNFSSGASDAKFLRNLNELFGQIEGHLPRHGEAWRVLHEVLVEQLQELSQSVPALRDPQQAQAVLQLTFEQVLPAYRRHHRDLLFHQPDRDLFRPFFIGRVFEAVLAEGSPWDETDRIVAGALLRLNDFVGHRPLAVLSSEQKVDLYRNERVRPVPLYVQQAGVAAGRYHDLVKGALELLKSTSPELLRVAYFSPEHLDELSFDPRAYDFNHPVNKRPNYHFGQWDPHQIDNQGNYRRFVLQQTLLEALLERVETTPDVPREHLLVEASVVLAGTMLMASGTSGSGPDTHDSTTTLSVLLPRIAEYRDQFYRQVLDRITGPHAARLREEAVSLRQPFAAARQHLNAQLARRRALQLQHVQLAILFARLGYPEAAMKQANIVPAASARMQCTIHCLLTSAAHAADAGKLTEAVQALPQIESNLKRGIDCGAIVDPWNIIGFGGQFSLFPAVENSVPDLRVDDLLDLLEQVFSLHSRLWHDAVLVADTTLQRKLADEFRGLAEWWDRFATTSVSSVKRIAGADSYAASARVAEALTAWHKAGGTAGDLAFWRPYAERFDSPHAYARVVEALLENHHLAAAQAILMHWLGQAETIELDDGMTSFHRLIMEWLQRSLESESDAPSVASTDSAAISQSRPSAESAEKTRRTIERFFDHLEANAESFWQVPELDVTRDLLGNTPLESVLPDAADEPDDEEDLYGAAYEEVIYRDSTGDGIDADMLESGTQPSEYELEGESSRLANRLSFLTTLARLWKLVALYSSRTPSDAAQPVASTDAVAGWLHQAATNRQRLGQLAQLIERQPLTASSSSHEALLEYDRRRIIKETLLEKIVATSIASNDAELLLRAISDQPPDLTRVESEGVTDQTGITVQLWSALLDRNVSEVQRIWPTFLSAVSRQTLLYVPLTRGGDPRKITAARCLQQTFRELLRRLPRLGLLRETCQLIQSARAMERDHPLGAGAVTEFDRLFEVGYKAVVEAVIESSVHWPGREDESADAYLIECLQQVTEALLSEWLSHSRTLRLSVLEKVSNEKDFEELLQFVNRYGHDLFTQRFFNLGNLRAILHQGVDVWLDRLANDEKSASDMSIVADLDGVLPRAEAKKHLGLVIEAVVENFAEYRDYNATTTQSDRGELVYMLLDFLRAKVGYERVHWNLRPVMMAHEVLVRRGHDGAAELWRRAMADRTAETADQHVRRLLQLQKKYGMRLPTVADRLAERFIRPLAIDRIRALVKPAAQQARADSESLAFEQLELEAGQLAQEPTGAGLDLPDWLVALEDEVDRACSPHRADPFLHAVERLDWVHLSWQEIQAQLSNWEVRFLDDKS